MKKIKVTLIFFLTTIILSLFVITASAEEIDYNSVIAIGESDYEYYSIAAMGTDATWASFISYYSAHEDSFPFTSVDGYVIYKGQLLKDSRNSSTVKLDSLLYCASNRQYIPNNIYYIEGSSIRWRFPTINVTIGTIVSAIIHTDEDSLFSIGGFYGNYHIYYDNRPLFVNSDLSILLGIEHYVSPTKFLYFGEKCDNHIAIFLEYTTVPTCLEDGIALYKCRSCGLEYEVEISASDDYHNLIIETIQASSCVAQGYESSICTICGETIVRVLPLVSHRFTVPTCTDPSTCSVCGAEGQAATDHNYILGVCTECGDNKWKNAVDKTASFLGGLFNGGKNAVNNAVEDLIGGYKDLKSDVKSVFSDLISILSLLVIIIALSIAVKLIKRSNNNSEKRYRRK